ncbi:MAG: hypothetical protein NTV79_08235, partial [Candidatus Aureabacteria bacterium]|nr:hypothetical protein [Candidatus Auribacterota bacterium]
MKNGWSHRAGAILFAAIATAASPGVVRADVWADYTAALADASADATPEKISQELTPIAPYNQNLIWENPQTTAGRV